MQFQKAEKSQSKLRLAIFGPSGSGKTYSSLAIASGMGKKIALIDTERGSASKYADLFEFDVLELPKKDIETYTQAIQLAVNNSYDVLIVDTLSHAWKWLLSEVDRIARTKFNGNTWAAWSQGTPKQMAFIDTITGAAIHIISTMRVNTEWVESKNDRGKTTGYERVGLNPQQGKGIEYEFDMLMELSMDHTADISKDRTGKYQDKSIEKPGAELGKELAAWLAEGIEYKPPHWSEETQSRESTEHLLVKNGMSIETFFKANGVDNWDGMVNIEGSGKEAYFRAKEFHLAQNPPDQFTLFCDDVLARIKYYKNQDHIEAVLNELGIKFFDAEEQATFDELETHAQAQADQQEKEELSF